MEELLEELQARGIRKPRVTGITHQLPDHDEGAERSRLEAFLRA